MARTSSSASRDFNTGKVCCNQAHAPPNPCKLRALSPFCLPRRNISSSPQTGARLHWQDRIRAVGTARSSSWRLRMPTHRERLHAVRFVVRYGREGVPVSAQRLSQCVSVYAWSEPQAARYAHACILSCLSGSPKELYVLCVCYGCAGA